jgi:membrane protein
MMLIVVAIAGFIFGERAAEGRIVWEIQGIIGRRGAAAVEELLQSARNPASGALATSFGLAALLFGATAVLSELRDALNTIWHVRTPEASSNWMSLVTLLKRRAFSLVLIVGIGFLLMLSLVVNAALSTMGAHFSNLLPLPEWILQLGYSLVSFLIIVFLFALLYRLLPDVRLEWGDVLVGAAVTSLLFTAGKLLIGFYLGRTSMTNTYGAAGSLVLVLLWVYYSAQIFFFGAEFTCVYTQRHGSQFRRNLELRPENPDRHVVTPEPEHREEKPELVITEPLRHAKSRRD